MKKAWTTCPGAGLGTGLMSRFDSEPGGREIGKLHTSPSRRRRDVSFARSAWSLAARLAAGTAGGALALYGASRRGLPGAAAAVISLGLLGRALGAGGLRRMFGIEPTRPVDIRKTMTIRAPADRIVDFWTKYSNAPSFMRNVRTTRMTGDGRSHWVVIGPSGAPMGWDAKLVPQRPSKLLAWQTEKDAAIRHAGTVRFIDNSDGTSTVALRMTCHPPADSARGRGGLPDIATWLDEDLTRMRIAIESGIVPVEDRKPFGEEEPPRTSLQHRAAYHSRTSLIEGAIV